jgi:transcriptional regulator with XRE-family HTH domain
LYYICKMQDRISKLLTHFGYTATRFADEIGVQRSGISHILSGRNHPSYDFILKIMKRFPEINLEWLVLGKGDMLKSPLQLKTSVPADLFSQMKNPGTIPETAKRQITTEEIFTEKVKKVTNVTIVDQIVIFYADGTYRSYYPAAKD